MSNQVEMHMLRVTEVLTRVAIKRTALHLLACAMSAAVLAGCASMGGVATQATPRGADSIASEASTKGAVSLSAAWPSDKWWLRYGDAQLDRLMEAAFRDSPSLHIASARIRQAMAVAGLAQAATGPQASASLKDTRQQYSANSIVPKPLAGGWAWFNEAALNFGYEFDFWGKNHAALEAAVGRVKASEADAYASRLVLAASVTQAYLRLAQAFDQLDLAQATLKTRENILSITRQRVAAEVDSLVELKQAELAIPAARQQIAQINESIALIRTQLAALVGQGPDQGLQIARPRLLAVAPSGVPASLSAELVGRRPDLVAQRWRVEALRSDIGVAKARFYPNINLTALIGFQSLGFGNFLNAGSRVAGIGPAITLPIFDGGRLRSDLAARSAAYDVAVEQYNQTLIDAVRDVVSQLTSIQWLQERRQQQTQALNTAREAYDLALRRYRSGLGNYLQVLVAENQVLAQKHASIDLDARAFELDVNLVRALGGGYRNTTLANAASIKATRFSRKNHE
jgi:NodT family efflux transporter outer membrane factor (OMF) lipoprotein